MEKTPAAKAQVRRALGLVDTTVRRTGGDNADRTKVLPEIGPEEIGHLFRSIGKKLKKEAVRP
jgi:hypothetical protein